VRDDSNNAQSVLAAFDILIEEIEEALRRMHAAGASALETRYYDRAQAVIEHARQMMEVREKVSSLKSKWKDIEAAFNTDPDALRKTRLTATVQSQRSMDTAPAKRRPSVNQALPPTTGRLIAGRIRKGLRTPEAAFFRPILQALSDLGGAAKRSDVFKVLEPSMRDVLQPIDYQTLSSETEQVRWQNSAQWARNLMVKEGLLQPDSPVGIWEMTEKGRAFLLKKSH
jgi:restriction system protein